MTNLHESYLAGFGFDITTAGLKTGYRTAALPTAGPGEYAYMYVYVQYGKIDMYTRVHSCIWVLIIVHVVTM